MPGKTQAITSIISQVFYAQPQRRLKSTLPLAVRRLVSRTNVACTNINCSQHNVLSSGSYRLRPPIVILRQGTYRYDVSYPNPALPVGRETRNLLMSQQQHPIITSTGIQPALLNELIISSIHHTIPAPLSESPFLALGHYSANHSKTFSSENLRPCLARHNKNISQ